jgi:hypothetical protein
MRVSAGALEGLAVDRCCPHDEISSNLQRTVRCLFIAQSSSFRLGRHQEKTVRVQLSTKSPCLAKGDMKPRLLKPVDLFRLLPHDMPQTLHASNCTDGWLNKQASSMAGVEGLC